MELLPHQKPESLFVSSLESASIESSAEAESLAMDRWWYRRMELAASPSRLMSFQVEVVVPNLEITSAAELW